MLIVWLLPMLLVVHQYMEPVLQVCIYCSWASLFEDNAEYGYGMLVATNVMRNRVRKIMEDNLDNTNREWFEKWLSNLKILILRKKYENIDYNKVPKN